MNDIDAVARTGHICCDVTRAIESAFEPPHHRKAHQPAVDVVKWRAEILRQSVVLAKCCDNKYCARYDCADHHRLPRLLDELHNFIVREYEVAHQEGNRIENGFI